LSIEYREDLLDEIRAAGEGVSGVLFGTRADDSVRVIAWRQTSFSAKDPRDLVKLVLAAKQDPTLQSLQPVGWFVSRANGGISLGAPDLEIFDGFFSEPWQVALVLNGERAGFFAREAGGKLRSESSYREFTIEATPKAKYWRWLWAAPTVFAMVLAALMIKPERHEPVIPVTPGFSLRIQDNGQINWDPAAVRASNRAEIDVEDGAQHSHFQVTSAQLRAGKLNWQRHTGDVHVRMTVYPAKGAAVREFARLKVSTITAPAPPPPAEPDPQVKKLTEQLHQEKVQTEKLRNMVKILENRLGIDGERKP
jgi:hypothetical protein